MITHGESGTWFEARVFIAPINHNVYEVMFTYSDGHGGLGRSSPIEKYFEDIKILIRRTAVS
jgi:hypothetical protein